MYPRRLMGRSAERIRDDPNVIEISSDEEESPSRKAQPATSALRIPGGGEWHTPTGGARRGSPRPTPTTPKQVPGTPTPSKKRAPPRRPQIVETTSADAAEDEAIVLTDTRGQTPKRKLPAKPLHGNPPRTPSPNKSSRGTRRVATPEGSDIEVEVLGTPLRNPSQGKLQPLFDDESSSESSVAPSTPDSDDSSGREPPDKYTKYWTPAASRGGKVATPSKASSSKTPQKPVTERDLARLKREIRARQERTRVEYAEQVYSYLNKIVFGDKLPLLNEISLIWNNRLQTTAGRAQYHRDRHGNQFVEIHLATRILDCHERIRNTLGHEMCHLACWIISDQIQESHGKLFRMWADKVERKDPNITVSVEHTYEISYEFTWECQSCNNVIGRHRNSLDINKPCRKCKTGQMEALFDDADENVVKKTSKMAAAKTQNSPRPSPRPCGSVASTSSSGDRADSPIYISDDENEELESVHRQNEVFVVTDSASGSDAGDEITELARKFGGITIAHSVCLHARRPTRAKRVQS
ncbi:SprT-like family-domain-containing protein [Mycena belliarum]|uniref:SprT-like family-domain-containing protein n=1 Tax=Mycena belliarum TaxID=1033014 RepID=A0AAD6UG98_9AGAR|nr:SprT-like family-domain-containing protein [Mycena belliae]